MFYGYARCSSADQSLDIQIDALKAAGCQIIRSEKISGTSRDGRRDARAAAADHRDIIGLLRQISWP